MNAKLVRVGSWLLRIALAMAFLSAVADRFGLWGPPGSPGVGWGDLTGFNAYVAKLNWFVPAGLIPVVGWASTAAETGLALADSGIGPQGAAGLLGLHRSSRSIPALRYSAKSHERNMNMRGSSKIGKGLTNR